MISQEKFALLALGVLGERSWAAETEQLAWASKSHSWHSTRLSVEQRTEAGCELQLSQIWERVCLRESRLAEWTC